MKISHLFLMITILFFAVISRPVFSAAQESAEPFDNVVKVFVTSNSLDFYHPWQSEGSKSMTGSGAVIAGNRIITNAHVVSDNTFIQVRKVSDPQKYTARVLAVGYDCDLALLTVDDPKFFQGITPFDFGELPKIQESVTVVGYPEGGDKLSITEGVVSRIEITPYVLSSRQLLTVQIDAAINPGNSGGPVIQHGKLVGIAMQGMLESQNIGYMIPMPIITHFMTDWKDGKYDGFPVLGIDVNNTENQSLRRFYKIEDQEGGILISKVMPFSPADGVLAEGDVVFSIDDTPIAVDGTFKFRKDERLTLSHLINSKQMNDKIKIKFSRNGKMQETLIPLKSFEPLVPPPKSFDKPPYYIYGGLVFTVLSVDLLKSWGQKWWEQAPLDFIYYLAGTGRLNDKDRKDIIVLLQVLPDDINIGYHNYQNLVVDKVNGKSVSSFKDFVTRLQQTHGEFATINMENDVTIVLPVKNIDEIDKRILDRNSISAQFSPEVGQWLSDEKKQGE